jgi:hypothetical protein
MVHHASKPAPYVNETGKAAKLARLAKDVEAKDADLTDDLLPRHFWYQVARNNPSNRNIILALSVR